MNERYLKKTVDAFTFDNRQSTIVKKCVRFQTCVNRKGIFRFRFKNSNFMQHFHVRRV